MNITIIGCGAMGSAFAVQWALQKHKLTLCDHSATKAKTLAKKLGARFELDPKRAVQGTDLVLFAIKPHDLDALIEKIGSFNRGQILLSILAGVRMDKLRKMIKGGEIVRLMPNLAVRQGKSALALVENSALSAKGKKRIEEAMEGLGVAFWVDEKKIDAVTAVAGSGPAFVLSFIESFVEGGILLGLSAKEAMDLTLQAIEGAIALLKEEGATPQQLRWQISSPGGMTIQGLKALEEGNMRASVMNALCAAFERARGLQR